MLHSTVDAAPTNRLRKTRYASTALALAASLLLSSLVIPPATAAPPAEDPATTEATTAKKKFRLFGKKHDQSTDEPAPRATPPKTAKSSPPPKPKPAPPAAAPKDDGGAPTEKKGWFQRLKETNEVGGSAAPTTKRSTTATTTSRAATSTTVTAKKPRTGGGWFNRTAPPLSVDDTAGIIRLQIFLDQSHFGPGRIDGSLGGFTNKAVANYNRSRGIEPDNWYYVTRDASRAVRQAHTIYIVRAEDWNHVGSLPYDAPSQAKKKYMPYRSMRELVSERFHTSEAYLNRANPETNLSRLKTGDEIIVPNVAPFRIEAVTVNQIFPNDPALSARHLIVDTKDKVAFIHEPGENSGRILVAAFPITPGHERYIPYGNWNIATMVTTPTFRYDKQMLKEGVRGDDYHMLPAGPNNPVGIFWAGLSKSGIGLHGTNNPDTIGRARSSGCIRLANWDAIRLSRLIRPGATVEVR